MFECNAFIPPNKLLPPPMLLLAEATVIPDLINVFESAPSSGFALRTVSKIFLNYVESFV